MRAVLTVVACVQFAAFVWVIRGHFLRNAQLPAPMRMLSLAGLFAFAIFIEQLWTTGPPPWTRVVGLVFFALSSIIFVWSVAATRQKRLWIAFETNSPEFLLASGPYEYIRHPFYTSYSLFWIGCFMSTQSIACFILMLLLFGLYFRMAASEEKTFRGSLFGDRYAAYSIRAGMFWPKLSSLVPRKAVAKFGE